MNEIALWEALWKGREMGAEAAQPFETASILCGLEALALQPWERRLPFFGALPAFMQDPAPEIRAAAYRVASGAYGPLAWESLITGLGDSDEIPRLAALESLRLSALMDWSRWLHALLHPDLTIRQKALQNLPPQFPKRILLPLLLEEEGRPAREMYSKEILDDPESLALLLSLSKEKPEAREMIQSIVEQWTAKQFANALQRLPVTGPPLPKQPTPPSKDELASEALAPIDDPLHTLFTMAFQSSWTPALCQLTKQAIQKGLLSPRDHLRLAIALTRLHLTYPWQEDTLFAAGSSCIALFREDSGIPFDLRERTLQLLLDGYQGHRWPDPLGPLVGDPILCKAPSTAELSSSGEDSPPQGPSSPIDLGKIASLLRLAEGDPYVLLVGHLRLDTILTLLPHQIDGAAELLRLSPPTKKGIEIRKTLLLPFLDQLGQVAENVLTGLILDTPTDQLDFLAALESAPERFPRLLERLSEEAFRRSYAASDKKLLKLARKIGSLLPAKTWAACLQALVSLPEVLSRDFATECLAYMALHPPQGQSFASITAQLPLRALKACLQLFEKTDLLPLEAETRLQILLQNHPDEEIRAWRSRSSQKSPEATGYISRFRLSDKLRKLERQEARRIGFCKENELPDALLLVYETPIKELCKALEKREASAPSVEICAALLICHDPLEEIAPLLARFGADDVAFLNELQRCVIGRCQMMKELPLAAKLWMASSFAAEIEEAIPNAQDHPKAPSLWLFQILKQSLRLPYPPLQWAIWKAAAYLLGRWRWRSPRWIVGAISSEFGDLLAAVLTLGRLEIAGLQALLPHAPLDLHLQEAAAKILVNLHQCGNVGPWMPSLQKKILPFLSSLPAPILAILEDWIASQGIASRAVTVEKEPADGLDVLLRSIKRQKDPRSLIPFCLDPHRSVAEAGAYRLLEVGGAEILADLLLQEDTPPSWRALADTLPFWPAGPALAKIRQALASPCCKASHRFVLALGFLQMHELFGWPCLRDALHDPESEALWQASDWDTLIRFRGDPKDVALELLESPLPSVYLKSLETLLAHPDPLPPSILDGFRRFLKVAGPRMESSRLEVALRLFAQGDLLGFPLLLQEFLRLRSTLASSVAASSPPPHSEILGNLLLPASSELRTYVVSCAFFAGNYDFLEHHLASLLLEPPIPPAQRQDACALWLRHSRHREIQEALFRSLPPSKDRTSILLRLAHVGAWGVQIARKITGRLFQISLIGGQHLGYTRLSLPEIFINPLPLLRGEENGEDIVKALILHEIGHHLYHKGEEAEDTWKKAEVQNLFPLLNFVSDEHLERRLRVRDRTLGDLLKRLAAYAFQHSTREIPADQFFGTLKERAFSCLRSQALPIATLPGHIAVPSGTLLREMEAKGLSFARFLRALRMGLGNRHNDPLLDRALPLFDRQFRSLSFPALLPIAKQLRSIFGSETSILQCMSQDLTAQGDICETFRLLEGLTQEEFNEAVQRQLQAQSRGAEVLIDSPPRRFINLDPDESFAPLTHVVRLTRDPLGHQSLARETARFSRHLRETLIRLGLNLRYRRRLMSGPRLDTQRLRSALLLGDPRFLQARRTVLAANLFLGILVDCSSSMQSGENIDKAKSFAVMLAEAARGLSGIEVRVFGFNHTSLFDAGDAEHCAASQLRADGGNNDAGGLAYLAEVAMKSSRSSRLLVMISDGSPTECSVAALRALVHQLTKKYAILCAQVAVRPLEAICFPHYVELLEGSFEMAVRRFSEIIASLVFKALRS